MKNGGIYDFMPGGSLSKGVGPLYPFEPFEGRACGRYEKIGSKHPWFGHSVLMNKTKQPWQNIDYVYGLFSDQKRLGQKRYRVFVEKGIPEGKRPDLVGGWTVLKGFRKAGIRVKGDERILGAGDFVEKVLKSAEEELEQKYDFKAKGYDFDRVMERVAEGPSFGKSPQTVKARSLLCFWAHRKLGMTAIEIGRKLNIRQSAVSGSSMRGQKIERENGFELLE